MAGLMLHGQAPETRWSIFDVESGQHLHASTILADLVTRKVAKPCSRKQEIMHSISCYLQSQR